MSQFNDQNLDALIQDLKKLIVDWCEKYELWYDCGFTEKLELVNKSGHVNQIDYVLGLWCEGPLFDVLNDGPKEFSNNFNRLIDENTPFCYGYIDPCTMVFAVKK